MKPLKFIYAAAIAATTLAGFTSCEKEPGTEGDGTTATLALADALDAEIILNSDNTTTFNVSLETELTADQLKVTETSGADWCSAEIVEVEGAPAVKVTPGANPSETDLTAEFKIEAVGVEGVEPITFKVVRRGSNVEAEITVSGEGLVEGAYGMLTFNPPAAGATLTLTINTNMERWYLNDMNQVMDDEYNPIEWYTVDKKSGRNGETITIVFSENTGTDDRMTSLMFVSEEDEYMGSTVTVTQSAKPATSAQISLDYGSSFLEGISYTVSFGKDDARNDGFSFDIKKDGSVELIFVEKGTTTPINTDDSWVNLSSMYGYEIVPTANTTGASRSVDLIITPAGDTTTVLFRFEITQAGE